MSEPGKAVFLSYASQDAAAVARIADALRAAGVEVWFDQNELVGGDAWDQKIRKQIKECALFLPVISANTNARAEGYFRLEWKLAVDRSHLMADDAPFLFPVVIDETADAAARVPDRFREVQWTRLKGKDTPESLAARVAKVLAGEVAASAAAEATPGATGEKAKPRAGTPERPWVKNVALVGGLLIGLVYAVRGVFGPVHVREAKPAATPPAPSVAAAPAATALSPARQLAEKARLLLDSIDSNPDDFVTAEGLLKRALELEQNDGEIWAISSRLNSSFLSRGFDRGSGRLESARSQAERALKLAPNSVESLLAIARVYRVTDPARTEAVLRQALAQAPRDGRVLLNLGGLYRVQGRSQEAMDYYEQAAAVPESMALARYDQFLVSFYERKFADADRYIRQAAESMATVNIVTGQAMLELTWRGQPAAALRIVTEAPGKMRAEPRALIVTVWAAQMNRQPEIALQALRRFSADFVTDAWYTGPKALLVGHCEAQAGRPEAARIAWEAGIALLRRRLEEKSHDSEEQLRLGELYAWSGQTEAALRQATIVTELTSGRRTDWTWSAVRIYAALGRADVAVPLLEKELAAPPGGGRWPLTRALLRLDPLWDKLRDDPGFQALCREPASQEGKTGAAAAPVGEGLQLALRAKAMYEKVGFTRDDLAPAEDLARRATEKEPDNAAVWGIRAAVQSAWLFRGWDVSEKRRLTAQQFANQALALDPKEPEALFAIGLVLRSQQALDQAAAHLRRAVDLNPGHVRLARSLGYALHLAGQTAESRAVLTGALKLAPRDPLLRYDLALAYASYASGAANPADQAQALEQLDIAIALEPFSSAIILKAAMLAGWRGDLAAMRTTLDQQDKLPISQRAEDRSVCIAMWAGLLEQRADRVEAAAALTARNYFDDVVMPLRPKAWSLALVHRRAGKQNLARSDWQSAEAVLRQRLQAEPGNRTYQGQLAITLAWLEQSDEAGRLIGSIEPIWRESPAPEQIRLLAHYYAAIGDGKKASEYLAQAIDRDVFTTRHVIPLDPTWDKVREHPDFVALLQSRGTKK